MSLFEDLCKKYSDKRERDIDFARKSGSCAAKFAASFQEYINAPTDTFSLNADSGRGRESQYVEMAYVDINWKETSRNFHSLNDMCFDLNGFLRFYLLLTLDHGRNSYPKMTYEFHCGIRPINEKQCKVFIGRPEDKDIYKEFIWTIGESVKSGPEQYVVDLLVRFLDREPFLDSPISA